MRINKHSWCCVPSCCWCQHLTRGRPNTWPAVGWDSWDWGLRVNIASLEHIPGYRVTSWQWMLLQTIAPQSWYICLLSFHNFWQFFSVLCINVNQSDSGSIFCPVARGAVSGAGSPPTSGSGLVTITPHTGAFLISEALTIEESGHALRAPRNVTETLIPWDNKKFNF